MTELACWMQIRAKNEIAGICESMGKKWEFSSDEGALQNTHNYVLVFLASLTILNMLDNKFIFV